MKQIFKLIAFFSLFGLLLVGSCIQDPPEGSEAVIKATVKHDFKEVGFIRASLVADFEHQYDTAILEVYKYDTVWHKIADYIDPQGPEWGNIGVTNGYYTLIAKSGQQGEIFSEVIEYSGSLDSAEVVQGLNEFEIQVTSDQGLVLVDTTGLDGLPSLNSNNGSAVFSRYGKYYYQYVRKGTQIEIRYSMEGNPIMLPLFVYAQKIYVAQAQAMNVIINDPFIEVIQL